MKTNRFIRLVMYALDTVVLFFLHLFRKFDRVTEYADVPGGDVSSTPKPTENTLPARFGMKEELEINGKTVSEYQRKDRINFPLDQKYAKDDGIVTFRGDQLRSGSVYGSLRTRPKKLCVLWNIPTGKLEKNYGKGYWTGSGWTGQPLIVKWPGQTRAIMNLYPDKKKKDGLIEAVYSTMDGNVYFIDIETGEKTRDEIQTGLPFKGSGALDPRGIPLLYLGPGDSAKNKSARALIYSLVNGEKLYEFGEADPFALRKFHGYDSSPLVCAQADTLIAPAENGILYTIKLNTQFDQKAGTLRIAPDEVVKLRYSSGRSSEERYWLGMEDSGVIWKNYLYIADNGGNLMCINLNSMKMIWVQDVVDDTNGSPVFSVEDGVPYLYIATSLHWTASRRLKLGDVPVFKINALNGEYVWKHTYLCNTVAGVSGGVQATCVNGKQSLENLVIFPIARTPQVRSGILAALDKKTGKTIWNLNTKRYVWSSPCALYDAEGNGYIITCNSVGDVMLVDGTSGTLMDSVNLGANIEATPAVYNNILVVGTRGQQIYGITIE